MDKEKRKVIQISASSLNTSLKSYKVFYALCSDGTMWERDENERNVWIKVPDIPDY